MRAKRKPNPRKCPDTKTLKLCLLKGTGCLFYGLPRGRYEWSASDEGTGGCLHSENEQSSKPNPMCQKE